MNVWKISPGRRAKHWNLCEKGKCILLGWKKLDNYLDFGSQEEIVSALGGGVGDGRGAALCIWRFTHDIELSDIVIANKGRTSISGIGIVTSGYLPAGHPDNPSETSELPHARRIK